jgi:hypothetical protein
MYIIEISTPTANNTSISTTVFTNTEYAFGTVLAAIMPSHS